MSKVYSFRLSDKNPREAQAREVIEAWVGEGYSLRHVIVEVLINYKQGNSNFKEVDTLMDQLQNLILSPDKQPNIQSTGAILSNRFLDSVKQSVRTGVRME